MSAKKLDLNVLATEEGVRTDVVIKSVEDEADKKVRLHKEIASFWIKEVGPFILAILFTFVMAVYCFVTLSRASSTQAERDLAWRTLSLILGIVLGTVFGKATEK